MRDGIHRDQKRNDVADRRRDRRTGHLQAGEEKQAVDQKRVEHKVDKIRGNVGDHRNPRVADAALSGGNRQTDAVEELSLIHIFSRSCDASSTPHNT